MPLKVLVVLGTRPEAIKLSPVIQGLSDASEVEVEVLFTGQHLDLAMEVLDAFKIIPDHVLDVMEISEVQGLDLLTSKILLGTSEVLKKSYPDIVVVQGDTSTTLGGALAAFYAGIPIVHVEAGLRTWDLKAPFPEEANRRLVAQITDLHLAPHEDARFNLTSEGFFGIDIRVVGNPGIDALHEISSRFRPRRRRRGSLPKVLVTAHRRENQGTRLQDILEGVRRVSEIAEVTFAVHPSPKVHEEVYEALSNVQNVHLLTAPRYPDFIRHLTEASVVLTDSGGVQEEALELGIPLLVLRDVTERPEAEGFLVGTSAEDIFEAVKAEITHARSSEVLRRPSEPSTPRIVAEILRRFG